MNMTFGRVCDLDISTDTTWEDGKEGNMPSFKRRKVLASIYKK